ncbi:MAG: hypothetical protein JRJ87_09065 [Deltaproteobacteria bacterium]|nr:hypothetical protein [Deltaproteobacteria bacterium]
MRLVASVFLTSCVFLAGLPGCGDKPIGQPCTFSWPRNLEGVEDCNAYPTCAPLQLTEGEVTVNPDGTAKNDACPIDCIQLPSLQCENLICVATQVEGDSVNMNGQCKEELAKSSVGCPNAPLGCMGYCTKECLSDASCPKGYNCSPMAPFGSTLKCDDEAKWQTDCTATCIENGQSPPDTTDVTCPSSVEGDPAYNYGVCDQDEYAKCCTCICYRFCSLLSKKFCRKSSWDEGMFDKGTSEADECGG